MQVVCTDYLLRKCFSSFEEVVSQRLSGCPLALSADVFIRVGFILEIASISCIPSPPFPFCSLLPFFVTTFGLNQISSRTLNNFRTYRSMVGSPSIITKVVRSKINLLQETFERSSSLERSSLPIKTVGLTCEWPRKWCKRAIHALCPGLRFSRLLSRSFFRWVVEKKKKSPMLNSKMVVKSPTRGKRRVS